jgi:hypothetical protein
MWFLDQSISSKRIACHPPREQLAQLQDKRHIPVKTAFTTDRISLTIEIIHFALDMIPFTTGLLSYYPVLTGFRPAEMGPTWTTPGYIDISLKKHDKL